MNWPSGKNIRPVFQDVAYSSFGFKAQRGLFSARKFFLAATGMIPNWAIDKDVIIPKLQEILPKGHMTRMNTAALLCALSSKHVHSYYDPVNFLRNFLKLYNAKSFDEVCAIEEIQVGSPDWYELKAVHNKGGTRTDRLEAVKIRCWAKDLEDASQGTRIGRVRGNHKSITVQEVEDLISLYPKRSANSNEARKVEELLESDGSKTLSAFPKDDYKDPITGEMQKGYLTLLREQRAKGYISETQCGIILCFILHSREQRRDGTTYVSHPMAVADLVRKHGKRYLKDEGHIWMATLAALLHDGGEKSNINLEKDLQGLLPQPTIETIKALHKKDNESYFQYLERCADNLLAAWVKLCDIYHNSTDAKINPNFKQTYVYPIAANYVQYHLKHPDEKLSVAEFVKRNNICTDEVFENIEGIAAHESDKKLSASQFREKLGNLQNLETINDIFAEEIIVNANPRREEDPSLQP